MANPMRQKAIQGLKKGDSFTFTRTFSKEETLSFGDLTRDYNPVHYDKRWSESKGFGGLICHGLLVGSMICEFGGQVGWLATGMNFKFIKPVYFTDTVTCTVTLTRLEENGRAEAEACFVNGKEETVCRAFMTGLVPVNQDRELLGRMVKEGDPTNKLRDPRP
jgi:acyl dehydratase